MRMVSIDGHWQELSFKVHFGGLASLGWAGSVISSTLLRHALQLHKPSPQPRLALPKFHHGPQGSEGEETS